MVTQELEVGWDLDEFLYVMDDTTQTMPLVTKNLVFVERFIDGKVVEVKSPQVGLLYSYLSRIHTKEVMPVENRNYEWEFMPLRLVMRR